MYINDNNQTEERKYYKKAKAEFNEIRVKLNWKRHNFNLK